MWTIGMERSSVENRVGSSALNPSNTKRWRFPTILSLLLFPTLAMANVPVPSMYGIGAPFFLSIQSLGVLFLAIVAIEVAILGFRMKKLDKRLILGVALANVTSSLLGALISGSVVFLWFGLAGCALAFDNFHKRLGMRKWRAAILASSPIVLAVVWIALTFPRGIGVQNWTMVVSLVPAFFLSVIIEVYILGYFVSERKHLVRWTAIANGGSYALLLVVFLIAAPQWKDNPLMTTDYLYRTAEWSAQAGDEESAMEMLDRLREFLVPYQDFYLTRELIVASILAKEGKREAALQILKRVETTPRMSSDWDSDIDRMRGDLRKALGQEEPSSPTLRAVPPPEGS